MSFTSRVPLLVPSVLPKLEAVDAVTLFHDENKNGKFDSNMIGYPLEGYGFSNNVVPQFRAPSFDECKFHYDGTGWKQIPVTMIYR